MSRTASTTFEGKVEEALKNASGAQVERRPPPEPDGIIHEATALAGARFGRYFDRTFAQTIKLRRWALR
jgi:hypothetical protein